MRWSSQSVTTSDPSDSTASASGERNSMEGIAEDGLGAIEPSVGSFEPPEHAIRSRALPARTASRTRGVVHMRAVLLPAVRGQGEPGRSLTTVAPSIRVGQSGQLGLEGSRYRWN